MRLAADILGDILQELWWTLTCYRHARYAGQGRECPKHRRR